MAKNIFLQEIENQISSVWKKSDFQPDISDDSSDDEKFFITVPYPYMNGQLHLGHLFTFIRASFMADYQRMTGKKVLFPFSFHSSGMPILSSCRLLANEIEMYGNPPIFPKSEEQEDSEKKKGKLEAKFGNQKYQWDIFKSMGIPESEIPEFVSPEYMIQYFIGKATNDLEKMGFPIDWRRTFTTIPELNDYYPVFVEWLFRKLESKGYLKKGKRFMIWSPEANCPCLAHDRSQGEKAEVVEYSIIRHDLDMEHVGKWKDEWSNFNLPLCLMTATMRPETYYGITNLWVNPNIEYKVARIEVMPRVGFLGIFNQESLVNLAYQEYPSVIVGSIMGSELVGMITKTGKIILPLDSVSSSKGTGIVMSVPTESPDDYLNLNRLKNFNDPLSKELFDGRYPLCVSEDIKQIVSSLEPIPIIKVKKNFGDKEETDQIAIDFCLDKGIKNPKSLTGQELVEAKKTLYQRSLNLGYYFNGTSVIEGKEELVCDFRNSGFLIPYAESNQPVVSRSGDNCVVALSDQWFIDYGNPEWKEKVLAKLDNVNFYHQITKDSIRQTIEGLFEWPVSRNFGLGTKYHSKQQPQFEPFLIDSLSDSTVYMALYTISHHIEEISKIDRDFVTPELFEAIFCDGRFPGSDDDVEFKQLFEMAKKEFQFWYPFDLRISGKDLIGNHLSYCLMTHMAIWDALPNGISSNGHVLIDGEKMSKSKGTFIMVEDSLKEYSISAIRMVLASIPTSPIDDSNYQIKEQDDWVLRLHTYILKNQNLIDKLKEINKEEVREKNLYDNYFENQLLRTAENVSYYYQKLEFYEVVKEAFFNLDSLFNTYCILVGNDLHPETLKMFLEYNLKMMTPLIPHLTQYCWNYWHGEGNIRFMEYPNLGKSDKEKREIDWKIIETGDYLIHIVEFVNQKLASYQKMKSKHAGDNNVEIKISKVKIILGDQYTPWQKRIIDLIKENCQDVEEKIIPKMIPIIAKDQFIKDSKINVKKMANGFLGMITKKIETDNGNFSCLDYSKALNKFQALLDNVDGLSAKLGLEVEVVFDPEKNPDKPAVEFS